MKNKFYIEKAKNYLVPALRQHRHNHGSDELIPAFDYDETIELVANLIEVANLGLANTNWQIRDVE